MKPCPECEKRRKYARAQYHKNREKRKEQALAYYYKYVKPQRDAEKVSAKSE